MTLRVATSAPGVPALSAPAAGASNQPLRPTFTWAAVPSAVTYSLQVATDPAFAVVVAERHGHRGDHAHADRRPRGQPDALLAGPGRERLRLGDLLRGPLLHHPGGRRGLPAGHHGRRGLHGGVRGGGARLEPLRHRRLLGGVRGPGAQRRPLVPRPGAGVGERPAAGLARPRPARGPGPGDRAVLELPVAGTQGAGSFQPPSANCIDGAILEVSTDGGTNWTRLESQLLTDPYDGPVAAGTGNPLAGVNAWCGDPQDWLLSVASLDAYAGPSVRFRFRAGHEQPGGPRGLVPGRRGHPVLRAEPHARPWPSTTCGCRRTTATPRGLHPNNGIFNVQLSAAWSQTVTVDYTTVPGTAQPGVDYTPVSGQVILPRRGW